MKKAAVDVENHSMSKEVVCQSCGARHLVPAVQCAQCNSILPFYTLNFFALFNVIPTLNPNFAEIDTVYFNFQKLLHPDKLRNATDAELDWADEHISQINAAYKALKNKLDCAKAAYLYAQDIHLPMSAFTPELVPQPNMAFLQQMMELSAQNDADANKKLYDSVLQELDTATQKLDGAEILSAISKFTYLNRLSQL